MKSRNLLILIVLILGSSFLIFRSGGHKGAISEREMASDDLTITENSDLNTDYKNTDKLLADISRQLNQPNVLKEDILRGWYLGGKNDRKFGTPDTWVFVEDGEKSKWMSPNTVEEGGIIDDRELCRKTAGTYVASCVDTSDSDCEYVDQSACECSLGSAWAEGQGCILLTERGSFVAINSAELKQGWYFGLPNEKKLNTPADWIWLEKGKESVWTNN